MTWPFENDTSAVVKRLAINSTKSDKRSRLFLLLTIALSVCMVFSILLISVGTQEAYKDTQRNKAQIAILGVTDQQSASLSENPDVSWVGEYSLIGFFYEGEKTISVAYGNEDYFLHQAEKTFQGNIPQGNNEIMLPANYIEFSGKSYQVGDQITLDLTGTGQEKEYTLTAILNEEKESNGYYIYVSKELAQTISNNTLQVDAYTRLQTDAITSSAILDFAEKVAATSGIEKGQINLTEYFAVMTGAVKSGISIPVPILALITTFLAATIVYGVFYTKITKNIQMFGQLRTIGMTKLQIKRMARKEGRIYALEGIPVGLLAGLIIGYVGCPDGFHIKTALIYAVLIAVMAYIAVNIALFKPVRVAMNTSPVEGAKYLIYAGKTKISHKLHRKLNLLNLAKINIHRNRKKAILTLMMLGLSGAILITTATVAGSINPEKQARFKYFPSGDIHIQLKNTIGSSFDKESEPYGSSKIQLEDNPLESQALLQALSNIDGVEKITPSNSIYMTITFPGGSGSITSISDFFPVLNREQLTQVQAVLSSGIADYDKMSAENGILVAEGTAKTGDLLRIMGRSPDGSNFDIEAAVVGTYKRNELMESAPVVPGSPYFIMTYDTAQKLTGITAQTGVLSLEVQEEKWQDVLLSVQEIAEKNEKIEVNTIEQVMLSIQKYYEPSIQMFYMISAILFVFGSISLMNMLIVDFQSRKREIGLFEAIGTTQRQMKTILSTEIRIYLFSSLAISIIVGAILSLFVSAWLDSANHCISLAFPWPFLLSLIIVHFVIYFVFALYAGSELRKTSILSAIRE